MYVYIHIIYGYSLERYIRSLWLMSAMIQSLSSGGNMVMLDRKHCTVYDHRKLDVHSFTKPEGGS